MLPTSYPPGLSSLYHAVDFLGFDVLRLLFFVDSARCCATVIQWSPKSWCGDVCLPPRNPRGHLNLCCLFTPNFGQAFFSCSCAAAPFELTCLLQHPSSGSGFLMIHPAARNSCLPVLLHRRPEANFPTSFRCPCCERVPSSSFNWHSTIFFFWHILKSMLVKTPTESLIIVDIRSPSFDVLHITHHFSFI